MLRVRMEIRVETQRIKSNRESIRADLIVYRIVKVKRSIQSNQDKPSHGKLQLSGGLFTSVNPPATQADAKTEKGKNDDNKSETGKSLFNFSN